MALDQDYAVDAAELPASVINHCSLLSKTLQNLLLLFVVFGERNSHIRRLSRCRNTVTISFFFSDGSILNLLSAENFLVVNTQSFSLQKSDHCADLKLGIIFIVLAVLFVYNI
jgi:hypothetical protein